MFGLFQPDVRASDADREESVELLKRHYAAGRLTSEELAARTDAAYAAVGLRELDALMRDLPDLPPPVVSAPPKGVARRAGSFLAVCCTLLAVLVVAAAIPSELWALLLVFGMPLALMGLFVLLPVALPVLAMAWIARAAGSSRAARPRQLGRGSVWVSTWGFDDKPRRPHRSAGGGRRRGGPPSF